MAVVAVTVLQREENIWSMNFSYIKAKNVWMALSLSYQRMKQMKNTEYLNTIPIITSPPLPVLTSKSCSWSRLQHVKTCQRTGLGWCSRIILIFWYYIALVSPRMLQSQITNQGPLHQSHRHHIDDFAGNGRSSKNEIYDLSWFMNTLWCFMPPWLKQPDPPTPHPPMVRAFNTP